MNTLQDRLTETADAVQLPLGSSTEVVAHGRRRARRAMAGRVVAAVAVAGSALYGVQRLSRADDGIVQSTPTITTGEVGSPVAVGAADGVVETASQKRLAALVETRPAKLLDTEYEWAFYPAGSSQAVALRFGTDQRYALATADGAGEQQAVFERSGDNWAEVATFDAPNGALLANDRVISYPHLPDDGPQETRVFDIARRSWSTVAPPPVGDTTDTEHLRLFPEATVSAGGDSVLMLVKRAFQVDAPSLGFPAGWQVDELNARTVRAYNSYCNQSTAETPVTSIGVSGFDVPAVVGPTIDAMPTEEGTDTADCFAQFPTADLDLTAADRAVVNVPTDTLWVLDGAKWKPVTIPEPTLSYELLPGAILAENMTNGSAAIGPGEQRFFRVGPGARLEPLIGGNRLTGEDSLKGDSNRFVAAEGPFIVTDDGSAGDWDVTDLSGLADKPNTDRGHVQIANVVVAAPDGVVAAAYVRQGMPTKTTTLTSGEYQLRFGTDLSMTLTNAAGEPVPFTLSTDSGKIEAYETTEQGDPIGDDPIATFDEDWRQIPTLTWGDSNALLVSEDGLSFSVIRSIDIARSAGLMEEPSIDEFFDVRLDDGRIIAHVNASGGDPLAGASYVLVGTPK